MVAPKRGDERALNDYILFRRASTMSSNASSNHHPFPLGFERFTAMPNTVEHRGEFHQAIATAKKEHTEQFGKYLATLYANSDNARTTARGAHVFNGPSGGREGGGFEFSFFCDTTQFGLSGNASGKFETRWYWRGRGGAEQVKAETSARPSQPTNASLGPRPNSQAMSRSSSNMSTGTVGSKASGASVVSYQQPCSQSMQGVSAYWR